ncbi:MAG: hypothetical protein KGR98_00195 [Verrucomicrobia bacterium]|nr:hypothetical protein [Verrucomicrobiota bacterium]MDE3099826.1 hypothetical protein [Verrucomicrobiota bacterium]
MKFAVLSILMAAVAFAVRAADITGVVTLQGTPPPEVQYAPIMDDPTCSKLYTNAPFTEFYVVGKNGRLANVVVFLQNADGTDITGKSTGATAAPAVLDQKGCLYHPQFLAMQTGQKLIVKNSDPCVHNVHIISKNGNPEYNDAQMAHGPDLTYAFPKPEMFMKVQCDIHPWMFAWISLFDNPWFDLTANDGAFTIKNVPPGKYTIVASHYKLGKQSQTIEVGGSNVTVNFAFTVK